jgi:hypothetical protein
MRQLLRFLGLITGIGPLIAVLGTRWDAFDAYGVVGAGESRTLRLPAGAVSIAFETSNRGSRGARQDIPSIADPDGRAVPIECMGTLQGPSVTKSGYFADERIRKRFATAQLPAPGDYLVTASGCTVLIGSAV